MNIIENVFLTFMDNVPASKKHVIAQDKQLREDLSDQQIDDMIKDSFPASASSLY